MQETTSNNGKTLHISHFANAISGAGKKNILSILLQLLTTDKTTTVFKQIRDATITRSELRHLRLACILLKFQ